MLLMLIADKLFSVSYRHQHPCAEGLGVHTPKSRRDSIEQELHET
jgi:hypothetical protein